MKLRFCPCTRSPETVQAFGCEKLYTFFKTRISSFWLRIEVPSALGNASRKRHLQFHADGQINLYIFGPLVRANPFCSTAPQTWMSRISLGLLWRAIIARIHQK